MKRAAAVFVIVAGLALALPHAWGQQGERIHSFHSGIQIHQDGSMTVTETISVTAMGNKIKRGIYRDFPTTYRTFWGWKRTVPFELERVLRDGNPEPYHTERLYNGIRVYLGREGYFLPTGKQYTYRITYRTDLQLGFFEEHDELYWNVTGTDWDFLIDHATATVRLPEAVPADDLALEAYTGVWGAKGTGYTAAVPEPGVAEFETTRVLSPGEGLTVVVGFPKGIVDPYPADRLWMQGLMSNLDWLIVSAGLVLVFAYFMVVWSMYGVDPEPLSMPRPRGEPPEGIAPAAARFIWRMGYDKETFATALISMAVKRYYFIEEDEKGYRVGRGDEPDAVLAPEEQAVADALSVSSRPLRLEQKNHSRISKAIKACKEALRKEYENVYFVTNKKRFVPGVVLSGLTIIGAGFGQGAEQGGIIIFMSIWLTGWTVAVSAMVMGVISAWREALWGRGKTSQALGLTLFTSVFGFFELMGIGMLAAAGGVVITIGIVAFAVLNLVFYRLLKAPTLRGRQVLDELEAFRRYLGGSGLRADGDLAAVFEEHLPYAVALGMEEDWSRSIGEELAKSGRDLATHAPVWYHGPGWDRHGPTGFASHLGSAFGTAVASASTAPGSSSGGGGGGSSGGGGGGGGGGGW